MHLEIERRFLVNLRDFTFPEKKKRIKQAYLLFDNDQVLRVRSIEDSYFLTYKFKESSVNRLEFEYSIPRHDGEKLISLSKFDVIEKDRYYCNFGSHTWEIDFFDKSNTGLVIAEVESKSEDELIEFPNWVGLEISDDVRYFNFNLSVKPFSKWSYKERDS